MKYYFSLQWKRLERKFDELGINPWLGVIGCTLAFILISKYLFYKIEFASWIYLLIGVYAVRVLSKRERVEELRRMCRKEELRKWRLIENVWTASPFVIYLIYERAFWEALIIMFASIILSFISLKFLITRTIPTPFRKIPFESIVGFRMLFLLFIAFYLITFKAIQVDNFNLALVILAASYLVQFSFYFQVENDYFVWIHSISKNSFLLKKWVHSQYSALLLSAPLAIILAIYYPHKWLFLIAAFVIGHLWISASVFAKYAVFPKEMNVVQAFIFVIGILLFPFLILLIPFYIKQSKSKLELYLQ